MNKRYRKTWRVAVPAIIAGALPFLFSARVLAQETEAYVQGSEGLVQEDKGKAALFEYGANAAIETNYLWRGMYLGGLSLQGGANVGYAGLYFDMWWNLGVPDYGFSVFQPEVDLTVGFRRWGVDVSAMYVHNFNRGFFDFGNYAPGEGGNGLEVRGRYTVSDRIPLSVLWATRMSAKDGYIDDAGELKRAWSSYLEVSYTHTFANAISLYGAVGLTPWRSMYTGYKGGATVTNIDLRCWKRWVVSKHCGIQLTGQLVLNPYYMANGGAAEEAYDYRQLGSPQLNGNIGVKVFLIQ